MVQGTKEPVLTYAALELWQNCDAVAKVISPPGSLENLHDLECLAKLQSALTEFVQSFRKPL